MRVSEYFNLGRTQPTLDFVDVDVKRDTPLFLSPKALTMMPSEFGDECVHLIQNFFHTVLELIKRRKHPAAIDLLSVLREPNETHLGLSTGPKSRGRALGDGSARKVWSALSHSEAAQSGLLEDLEDTVLMIHGISIDIISDITTNIIREPLIRYTQQTCEYHDIPLTEGVDSGPLWSAKDQAWYVRYVSLPIADGQKLLFVPKVVVRNHLLYDAGEYFRHYILTHLQKVELDANTGLVQVMKQGTKDEWRRVTKTAVVKKYGKGKNVVDTLTRQNPQILAKYKKSKDNEKYNPLSLDDISGIEGEATADWQALLKKVLRCRPGTPDAIKYEKASEALLTALFYPNLTNPIPQQKIHEGRKRIDITYTNMGTHGFFAWLAKHYPSAHVFVECKNYVSDIKNPELDQMSGRFSRSRGEVGLVLCRQFENKKLFLERCKDTAKDGRGFIIALDDADLSELVRLRNSDEPFLEWPLLRERFNQLIN